MQIILRGPAAGYEAEHTARLFFPSAEKSENLPQPDKFFEHPETERAKQFLNVFTFEHVEHHTKQA